MAGILDMAAIGAAEAPADAAFSLKGALQPAVRDDDVEYEGMCRCLVEMLLNKEGMFCELYDKDDKFLGLNRIMVHKILKLIDPRLMDSNDEERAFNYIAPEQPADTSDPAKLEAAEQDAMWRFYQANSKFFTQVIVNLKAIRAAMLKNSHDFPGIKAPEATSPAAGTSPAATSKSRQLTEGERQQIRSETLVDDDWARSFFKTECGRRIAEALDQSGHEGESPSKTLDLLAG